MQQAIYEDRGEKLFAFPCPFCDSHHAPRMQYSESIVTNESIYRVRCVNCGGQGPGREFPSLAIDAWNKRGTEGKCMCRCDACKYCEQLLEDNNEDHRSGKI